MHGPSKSIRRAEVLEALKGWSGWMGLGVEWAVLFGGLARRGAGSDVDLLVNSRRNAALELALAVSEALNMDPDRVDIVSIEEAPCPVVVDAWRHGVVLHEARQGEAREWLLARVKVCSDYRIMARKLGVVEAAVKAARRRWRP